MSRDQLQVYESGDVRVTFNPQLCQHSGICLKALPAVFDVSRARWVDPDAASAHEVHAAVAKCPSGALQAQLITSVYPITPPPADH